MLDRDHLRKDPESIAPEDSVASESSGPSLDRTPPGPVTARSTTRHYCLIPGCNRHYSERKSLNRHLKSDHERVVFHCRHPDCDRTFSRLDHRNRHEDEQHDRANHLVYCSVCRKHLQARALDDHFKSNTHVQAEKRVDESLCLKLQTHRQQKMLQILSTESLINPLLLTTWLIYRLNLSDCRPDTWDGMHKHFVPSAEVLDLKGLATRVLMRSIAHPKRHEGQQLIRSIETMTVVEAMVSGWDSAAPHILALKHLRNQNEAHAPVDTELSTPEPYSMASILGNLAGVPFSVVDSRYQTEQTDLASSDKLLPWYYNNITHDGGLEKEMQYVHDPATFTMRILDSWGVDRSEPMGKMVYGGHEQDEGTSSSYEHVLDPEQVDYAALMHCWGHESSSATMTLSAPAALIRRNLHAFLCVSTETRFVQEPNAQDPLGDITRSHTHLQRTSRLALNRKFDKKWLGVRAREEARVHLGNRAPAMYDRPPKPPQAPESLGLTFRSFDKCLVELSASSSVPVSGMHRPSWENADLPNGIPDNSVSPATNEASEVPTPRERGGDLAQLRRFFRLKKRTAQ